MAFVSFILLVLKVEVSNIRFGAVTWTLGPSLCLVIFFDSGENYPPDLKRRLVLIGKLGEL